MKDPTYPGALSVAPSVVAHMARQTDVAEAEGRGPLAQQPGTRAVEALIDAAFWASFRREEGQPPTISLAFLSPDHAGVPLKLARPIPLDPEALARLSPAVERPGIHLGVWGDEDEMYVWGATRHIPDLCLVVEVLRPGMLVVKHRRPRAYGKFANVAVLEGDQVKVVDQESVRQPDCPTILPSLLGFDGEAGSGTGVLVRLAISMRAHGHGGTLLIVPSGSESWRESVLWPARYVVEPPHTGLAKYANDAPPDVDGEAWRDGFAGAIAAAAGLTAVDGATLMTDAFELLAFGVKIGSRGKPIDRLRSTEPIKGYQAQVVHPGLIGGTRHLSAAQFVHDQRDAVAFVASQDGRFTTFAWSPCHEMVQANRLDALLL
ncbi:MAG TPA: hypothetical protein VF190_03810 [Rhodothermales bacterium]